MNRFLKTERITVCCSIALLVVLMSWQTVRGQDFGQLLSAIDKIESNLRLLVEQEAAVRADDIKRLRAELSKLSQASSAKHSDAIFEALQSKVKQLSREVAATPQHRSVEIDDPRLQEILHEIDLLRTEIHSLKTFAVANAPNSDSLGKASQQGNYLKVTQKTGQSGAKYHNLRFNDNYDYLNNSSNRGYDLFDMLKRRSVGNSAKITFGGQYRFRFESDNNRKLGSSSPTSQEVYLNRLFLFGDLKIINRFRLFAEFKYAGIKNNVFPAGGGAHDRPDIENLFIDAWALDNREFRLGARIGRQELQFGKQRLISPLDWANTRRTFDGFRIMTEFGRWSIDAFVTRPVVVNAKEFNTPDQARAFSGAYASRKLNGTKFSGYFLVYTKDEAIDLATGLSGDFEYLTLGTGYDGKVGRFDWSTEAAYQFGSLGSKDVSAYMLTLGGGYLFKRHPLKPRIGLSWDIASGDNNPNDNKVHTFHQQFPLGHAWLGWADQVGRRNINAYSVQLSAHPSKTITTKLNWFSFNLVQKEDALYNAGGRAVRQDATGESGRHVGNELDALIVFKLNRHASFHLGYLHFAPGSFVENTGTSEPHNMLYMMLPVKF